MYKYGNTISELCHDIIKRYCNKYNIAIDCTLGNGHDTDNLSQLFNKVYSFDIQKNAIKNYKKICPKNVKLINDTHEKILTYVNEKADCIIFNLGYLPGGDKSITTKAESTLKSIKASLKILKNNGFIFICVYIGHEEGKREHKCISEYLKTLSKRQYSIITHQFFNRNNAPILISIEKSNINLNE